MVFNAPKMGGIGSDIYVHDHTTNWSHWDAHSPPQKGGRRGGSGELGIIQATAQPYP
jgi:hypothetical protein